MKRDRICFMLGISLLILHSVAAAQDYSPGGYLAHRYGCFQCHGMGQQQDAPAFRNIAQRYASRIDRDPDLVSHLSDNVQYGPSHRGSPQTLMIRRLNEGDLHTLIRWILTQQ